MDYDGSDMDLVKDITGCKVKPFTYTALCHCKMVYSLEIAEVVLIYNGDKHLQSSNILEQIFCNSLRHKKQCAVCNTVALDPK